MDCGAGLAALAAMRCISYYVLSVIFFSFLCMLSVTGYMLSVVGIV